jgi:hypothetical protein
VRLDAIRALVRPAEGRVRVTLADGRELELALAFAEGDRRLRVDDPRYGRVRIDAAALERVELAAAGDGSGPAYDDFPPGRPLRGSVTARDGRRFAGRLVYDLDESETSDTLDARDRAVHYTLSFGRIVAIVPPAPGGGAGARGRVTLAGGETLELERAGDLDDGNAGLLVFADGRERPDYLPWADVARIDLDPLPAGAPGD